MIIVDEEKIWRLLINHRRRKNDDNNKKKITNNKKMDSCNIHGQEKI
jgi:hypothetical protein